jgi:hypothetical protein
VQPVILPPSDEERLALKAQLETCKVADMTSVQIQQRALLRGWKNAPTKAQRWTPLKPEEPADVQCYDNGNFMGMMAIHGPYYDLTKTRSGWAFRRVRPRSDRRTRGDQPTRSRTTRARAKAMTRSSSRAGDSGDPDGDHEPPRLNLWRSKYGLVTSNLLRVLLVQTDAVQR